MSNKLNFISAGAGSGKTYRLTQILHEKLSTGEIQPSGVIATTFTKKAATELRERVRAHLLEQGDYKIANEMGQARIGTVHAICGKLLARFAFEAGLSTEQRVLDESQVKMLLSHSVDSVMNGEETAQLLALVRRLGIADWKNHLEELINQTRSNDIDVESLALFATKNADDLLAQFPAPSKEDISAQLKKVMASNFAALERALDVPTPRNITRDYLELIKAMHGKLERNDMVWGEWASLAGEKPEAKLIKVSEEISSVAGKYPEHPELHQDIRRYIETMFGLCARTLAAFANRKLEMGVLDFTDQEHLLLQLLDNETVASTLRDELDLLMVDEFQDTSPIQLALFLKLAQFAKHVYWVGDIKQAIYGFRGSDATLMKSILDSLETLGGSKEVLNKSYRSRAPLVNLVNQIFVPAFKNSLDETEISLAVQRSDADEGLPMGVAIANWELEGRTIGVRTDALATGIQKLVSSGYRIYDKPAKQARAVRYSDIAVLSRSNAGVNAIATALKSNGIPVAIEQAGLLQTPEVILAIACLRRLNDPSDTIASAEIVSLAGCEEPEVWVVDRLNLMSKRSADQEGAHGDDWREEGENAHPLLKRLAEIRTDMTILSPVEAIQTVIAEGHLTNIVLMWCYDESEARIRLANLEALITLVKQYEETSLNTNQTASVSGLILWMKDQSSEEQDFLAMPSIDAVKVMTHHRAKGLEWPVVILTDLEAGVRDRLWGIGAMSTGKVDVHNPLKNRFIRFWPWPFGQKKIVPIAGSISRSDLAIELHKQAVEEEKRLLYVSMTRARDLLILARTGKRTTGSWINILEADWLDGKRESGTLTMPDGDEVPYQHLNLSAPEGQLDSVRELNPISWFSPAENNTARMPLKFNPSSATQTDCSVVKSERIGSRMYIKAGVDMAKVGTAIHGCIGAYFTDQVARLTAQEIDAVFQRMSVPDAVRPSELLAQIDALATWIKTRWPEAKAYTEYPVEMKMSNGQLLQGRLDMLLKVKDGWILIDHKSNPGGSDRWEAIAKEYAGQLAAYSMAVEQATGEKVLEKWLFMPVAAGMVKIDGKFGFDSHLVNHQWLDLNIDS